MAKLSFAALKAELEDACATLREFTLGRRGVTQRDGRAAVERVSELCDRLKECFATGPHAGEAAAAATSGRTRVAAAQARLALLQAKH